MIKTSNCIAFPSIALAGEKQTWQFIFVTATTIPENTIFRFDILSQGKPGEWQIPDHSPSAKQNAIWMSLSDNAIIFPQRVIQTKSSYQYAFQLSYAIAAGKKCTIFLGSPHNKLKDGNQAQHVAQRKRPFHLFVDIKGKEEPQKSPEIFHLDVKGNVLHTIRIITPSLLAKNAKFDVLIRCEDIFENLTGKAPPNTLLELSYENFRDNLQWHLFVPETGFLTLPNLYFNEPGTYHIKLKNLLTGKIFYSAPIHCAAQLNEHLFWGILHKKSPRFEQLEQLENMLKYVRDNESMQFYATSIEVSEKYSAEDWNWVVTQIEEFNEEERFSAFLGIQRFGKEGIREILYLKDHKLFLQQQEEKCHSLQKIYKNHTPGTLLSIPCFTMGKGHTYNFQEYDQDFERIVEIYNVFGSSECSQKEGNPKPIVPLSKKGIEENPTGSIREALNRGCRFGFVAGGWDNQNVYQKLNEKNQKMYSQGLTAIFSSEYSQTSLFHALHQRHCYATTGERIIVFFNIAKCPMGSELNVTERPGLAYNRYIDGFIAGTAPLKEVAIFRNGSLWKIFQDQDATFPFAFYDNEPLQEISLEQDTNHIFTYYYVRVIQTDQHVAWGSPIWIIAASSSKKGLTKKLKA